MSLSVNPELDTDMRALRLFLAHHADDRSTTTTCARGEKILLKRDPVLGSFDPGELRTEFLFAPARDGTRIPVSLVYRKGFARDGTAPLLQYAYGAYGLSMDPSFSSARLSLLDRGFVYAIAHVRGGQEMGRAWYDDGRKLQQEELVQRFHRCHAPSGRARLCRQGQGVCHGRQRRRLADGCGRQHESRAITAASSRRFRSSMWSPPCWTTAFRSPPTNTTNGATPTMRAVLRLHAVVLALRQCPPRKRYPAMFVTTGLWDSQVQYYEPAKWIAKLRALKTDSNRVAAARRHGSRSRRQVRPLPALSRDRDGVRLPAGRVAAMRSIKKSAASGGSLIAAPIDSGEPKCLKSPKPPSLRSRRSSR